MCAPNFSPDTLCNILIDNNIHPEAHAHLSRFPEFAPVLGTVKLGALPVAFDVYLALQESIVSQQLSVKAADTIFKRFLGLFEAQYPDPAALIEMDVEQLRSVGLSRQKASYLQNVAQFAMENDLLEKDWESMSDEEVVQFLTPIKGIGRWSVEMILIFTLHRPDVFPVDDLGVQQGMMKMFGWADSGKELKKKMLEAARPWTPHRSTASRLLWRWKDTK